jgi:prepilin-type N-terminal cleavage/methylation domain-containing protein
MQNISKGFTLAEVLITLLIIGIIASIVIPGLIQDSQQAELKTAWKKAYAELAQTFTRMGFDNGGTLKGICSSEDDNCLKSKISPYLNFTKVSRVPLVSCEV